jgi:hypothetical protein
MGAYRQKAGESQVGNISRKKETVRLGAESRRESVWEHKQKEGESQVGT